MKNQDFEIAPPAEILKTQLAERIRKNPRYSVRALARDAGVSPSYVSQVLNGKKKLSLQRARSLSLVLKMDEKRANLFLRSVALDNARKKGSSPIIDQILKKLDGNSNPYEGYFLADTDQFQFISEWYHLAILDFTTCKGFRSSIPWVAARLKLSPILVGDAVDRLIRLKLLTVKGNRWIKSNLHISFTTEKSRLGIRQFHTQHLDKAKAELEKSDAESFKRRFISGMTMACNPDRLEEAKNKITRFQNELAAFLTEGECTTVYHLGIQVVPLGSTESL